MESLSGFPLLSIANIEVEKTLNENAENEHLDGVCVVCLFFAILRNSWLIVYMRIIIFFHSTI